MDKNMDSSLKVSYSDQYPTVTDIAPHRLVAHYGLDAPVIWWLSSYNVIMIL